MSVKITLEYDSVEEAIVALGKVVGLKGRAPKNTEFAAPVNPPAPATAMTPAPVAAGPVPETPKRTRKPRADAGQPRGPNARTATSEQGASVVPPVVLAPVAPTDAPPAAPQSAAPAAAATVPIPSEPLPAAADPVSDETVQEAVAKMFAAKDYDATFALLSRFGVKRGKDLPQDQRQNFINRVNGVVDRGEAI